MSIDSKFEVRLRSSCAITDLSEWWASSPPYSLRRSRRRERRVRCERDEADWRLPAFPCGCLTCARSLTDGSLCFISKCCLSHHRLTATTENCRCGPSSVPAVSVAGITYVSLQLVASCRPLRAPYTTDALRHRPGHIRREQISRSASACADADSPTHFVLAED